MSQKLNHRGSFNAHAYPFNLPTIPQPSINQSRRHCTECGKPISGRQWSSRLPENKLMLCTNHLKQKVAQKRTHSNWTPEDLTALKQLHAARKLIVQLKRELLKRHSDTAITSKARNMKVYAKIRKPQEAPLCSA
jgi:hypothetical protein